MQKFKTVDDIVSQLKPERPIYCIRKKSIQVASRTFQNKFPGTILYAVKTNPHPEVLKTILRKNDIIVRWGGEEFVIILDRVPNIEITKTIANTIREKIEATYIETVEPSISPVLVSHVIS